MATRIKMPKVTETMRNEHRKSTMIEKASRKKGYLKIAVKPTIDPKWFGHAPRKPDKNWRDSGPF